MYTSSRISVHRHRKVSLKLVYEPSTGKAHWQWVKASDYQIENQGWNR